MPTVLKVGGFKVRILLPPREHGPAHVHVVKAGSEVVIELEREDTQQRVRDVFEMNPADVKAAFRIVEMNADFLFAEWKQYHG